VPERVRREAERDQLPIRDYAVLLCGKPDQLLVATSI
jgi:hypothetical protein